MVCVYLPRPYLDETLHGVVSRHVVHSGAPSPMAVTRSLFGWSAVPSVDLPCGLDAFAESTRGSLGWDGAAYARRLTLAPYYAHYLDPQRRRACLEAMRGRPKGTIHNLFGLATSRVPSPRTLRLCPTCRDEDRSSLGETYWRRLHQLQGVLVCDRHGCVLRTTSVPFDSRGSRAYDDADGAEVGEVVTGDRRMSLLASLASRCADVLASGEAGSEPDFSVARRIGAGLRRPGAGAAMCAAFVAAMGEDLLGTFGCGLEPGSPHNWFLCLLRRPEDGFHPLQHSLVAAFVERLDRDVRLGTVVAPEHEGAARAASGDAAALKARWRRLLRKVPGRDRVAASIADPALRSALDAAVPGWVASDRLGGSPAPSNQRRLDAVARDRDWVLRIRAATDLLMGELPPRRVTRDALERTAGLPKGSLSRVTDLPSCATEVARHVEGTEAFHLRKVAHSAEILKRSGVPLDASSIRRHAKLTGPIGTSVRQAIRVTGGDGPPMAWR